ncbi:MAG: deoxyribodipyrimidine photo-lyase [Bacteroidota bacterium]|nr:deoxyribodipyrimidine photo-lyase [Bacteroidota bacterium]
MPKINIHWFRRDLRLNDNAALYHALKNDKPVLCLFIFDKTILDKLENKFDKRVDFIHQTIIQLKKELKEKGSSLLIKCNTTEEAWKEILQEFDIAEVFTNHDYEPAAILRDKQVETILNANNIRLHSYKDQVIFEKKEVVKDDGNPYTVFTPYSKKWKAKLTSIYTKSYPTEEYFHNLYKTTPHKNIDLTDLGFEKTDIIIPSKNITKGLIQNYAETRDIPSIAGTSRLGIHLRFGTISIREKVAKALTLSETFLNELIWREFYMQIIYHFPHVVENSFREKYDALKWLNNEEQFARWCEGQTGYPIVDAGMRELNETGYMHNRVRMIVASFLTKHLLIDWRWGEWYFAQKLLDYELASNNGGWQWAAGCGTDAAPYFRIFNPYLQTQKFDKDYIYIKKWVPEYLSSEYPKPIVDHDFARKRCLEVYKKALGDI